jgi:hypothetical protein
MVQGTHQGHGKETVVSENLGKPCIASGEIGRCVVEIDTAIATYLPTYLPCLHGTLPTYLVDVPYFYRIDGGS